jgi:hypothetical protein
MFGWTFRDLPSRNGADDGADDGMERTTGLERPSPWQKREENRPSSPSSPLTWSPVRLLVRPVQSAHSVYRSTIAPAKLVDNQPSVEEVRPRCPNCDALLDDTLSETPIWARRDGERTTNFSVVFCAACGATLGVVRPES